MSPIFLATDAGIAIVVFLSLLGVCFLVVLAFGILGRFINIDKTPVLRCSTSEVCGRITRLAFVKDAGFGDSPVEIDYEFPDSTGRVIKGNYVGTESSFHAVKVGDEILVRYDQHDPKLNAPRDAIGIITPVWKKESREV